MRATGDILHQFQCQKVKGQGHLAALLGCSSHRLHGAGVYCVGRFDLQQP